MKLSEQEEARVAKMQEEASERFLKKYKAKGTCKSCCGRGAMRVVKANSIVIEHCYCLSKIKE